MEPASTNRWEIRFGWETLPGNSHPPLSHEKGWTSREHAVAVAWQRWEKPTQGARMTEVWVREQPDGEWEHILPRPAACDRPSTTAAADA